MIIKTNSDFTSIQFHEEALSWNFEFSNQIDFNIEAFWRITKRGEIIFVSLDHGHLFGRKIPVDLEQEIASFLEGKTLNRIIINDLNGDLTLEMAEEIIIEIFISSSGYESYQFNIGKKKYIGLGGGNLSMYE